MSDLIVTPEGITRKHKMQTMYDSFEFGTESWRRGREGFREFPMVIPLVDGKPCFDEEVRKKPYDYSVKPPKALPVVEVHSEEELEALMAGAEVVEGASGQAATVATDDSVRQALYAECEVVGVRFDKRWSIERIKSALEVARGTVI